MKGCSFAFHANKVQVGIKRERGGERKIINISRLSINNRKPRGSV